MTLMAGNTNDKMNDWMNDKMNDNVGHWTTNNLRRRLVHITISPLASRLGLIFFNQETRG